MEDKLEIKQLFEDCKKRMNSFMGKRVPQYLSSTLKLNEKFDINIAISNIIALLNRILDNITNNEQAFINGFPNILENLFENNLINDKLKEHPMIKWKQSLLK